MNRRVPVDVPFDGGGMSPAEHLEAAIAGIASVYALPVDELLVAVRYTASRTVRRVTVTHPSWRRSLVLGRRAVDFHRSDSPEGLTSSAG